MVLIAGVAASTFLAIRAARTRQAALREHNRATVAEQTATLARDRALRAERISSDQRTRAIAAEAKAVQERNRALTEKQRADDESATAKAVSNFLQNNLLAQASAVTQARPDTKPDPDIKVRTALDRAAARIPGKFEAAIRQTIGDTYLERQSGGSAAVR